VLQIRLRDALGRVDHVVLAPELRIGLLEDFQRLRVARLRLHNDLEHLNRLQQLSFFTRDLCRAMASPCQIRRRQVNARKAVSKFAASLIFPCRQRNPALQKTIGPTAFGFCQRPDSW
jgi:hypothetical protein